MKVLIVTDTASLSGAGIAATRLHNALLAHGTASVLAVARGRIRSNSTVPLLGPGGRAMHLLRRGTARIIYRAAGVPSGETLSGNFLPSGLHRRIDALGGDVVHLHWIGLELLSVTEVPRIRKPVVMTLHDEWFRLGLEHYASDEPRHDRIDSAAAGNRSALFRLLDATARSRKRAAWRSVRPLVVCPSRWLAQRISETCPYVNGTISVVPNAVPTDIFSPSARPHARARLGLPTGRLIIGAGALNALGDPRKGYAQLCAALKRIKASLDGAAPMLLMFGAASAGTKVLPLEARFLGTIDDQRAMADAYAAMDVFVCPSTQENYPNTVAEALSCGTPCVAFRVGGIPEMIEPGYSGYLAEPLNPEDLGDAVLQCLQQQAGSKLRHGARDFALRELAPSVVANRYREVYQRAISERAKQLARGR